ncbi:MAG: hypothetical protein Q7S38_00540 [bacterium]|nr:hypothetical protein [bacterium]
MREIEQRVEDPIRQKVNQFAKIGRKLRVMQREGKELPQTLVDRRIKLDDWLTHNTRSWHSHFGFKRDEEI